MAKTPRILDIEKVVHGNKVKTDFATVPFTTIKNEQGESRKIADQTNNLKPSFGIERVPFSSLKQVSNEYASTGEAVYELSSKDARFRFAGEWESNNTSDGNRIRTLKEEDYMEVTFYGTGLNILVYMDNSVNPDWRASTDGGAEGSNLYIISSNILTNRNYKTNTIIKVVSGLTLGWHTVKIRQAVVGSEGLTLYGAEIINESAQLTINSGQPFAGGFASKLSTQQLLDVKPSSLTGTKGGRVVTYLKEDGEIEQVVRPVSPDFTGNIAALELIVNGTFDTDITSWLINNVTAVFESGKARVTRNGNVSAFYQNFTTVIGETYEVKYEVGTVSGSVNSQAELYAEDNNDALSSSPSKLGASGIVALGTSRTGSFSFTAVSTDTRVRLQLEGNTNASTTLDNISVKEVGYNFLALDDTNHSEEEVYRKINFREFGANRADDFSTLGAVVADRAFTLDDGTTTLVLNAGGTQTINGVDALRADNNGSFWTITFVGSGLDIICPIATSNIATNEEVYVDGASVGLIDFTPLAGTTTKVKICSGLPYGTHTVRLFSQGTPDSYVSDFIIYQPKKPELPSSAVEIADYNVMADYVVNSDESVGNVATGVLRKMSTREAIYNGTWDGITADAINFNTGLNVRSSNAGAYIEYTFYGIGVIYNTSINSGSAYNDTISIDGDSDLSGFTTSFKTLSTGLTFTPATGLINGNASGSSHATVEVSGLPLGIHTIRIQSSTTGLLYNDGIDIITPIHYNDTKSGSLALADRRDDNLKIDTSKGVDLTKAKAWIMYDSTNLEIIESYNISSALNVVTSEVWQLYFKQSFKRSPAFLISTSVSYDPYMIVYSIAKGVSNPPDTFGARVHIANQTGGSVSCVFFFGELEDEENIDLGDL